MDVSEVLIDGFDRLPGLRLAVPADEIPFKAGDTIQGMLELPVTW